MNRHWPLAAATLLVSACTMLPSQSDVQRQIRDWAGSLEVGCELCPSEATLRPAVGDDPAALDFARRIAAIETGLTGRPLTSGNAVGLLVDGPATHAAQLAAIASATHHVHLDVYILTDDDLGHRYAEALIGRARAGVQVRVIFDSVGGLGAGEDFRQRLRDGGVELYEYNSVNPLKDLRLWRVNRRSHRKLLIVDGRVAFTGGINIADEYSHASGVSGSTSTRGWRDTHIRVQGPAVSEFQHAFLQAWSKGKGELAPSAEYFPAPAQAGPNLVRLVTNHGADLFRAALAPADNVLRELAQRDNNRFPIYLSYLAALGEAKSRVWISQAYFAPNDEFIDALRQTATSGVDVRILLPGVSDVGLLLLASRFQYQHLLEAGVRIYEYEPVVMHAKTAVIDGVWSTVGSSNLDLRSFVHNDEANAIILGREFGAQMERVFEADLKQAREVNLAEWKKRPMWQRLKELGARLVNFWI